MAFTIENKEKYVLVSSNKDKLDSTISPELKSHFVMANSEGNKNIVIDLSDTRYCDSSGLSAILVGNRLCTGSNGSFILCGVKDTVMKLIEISQLNSILNIVPTVSEAEDYIFMEEIERGLSDE
jgi:anti-sigma B factor antagonist